MSSPIVRDRIMDEDSSFQKSAVEYLESAHISSTTGC